MHYSCSYTKEESEWEELQSSGIPVEGVHANHLENKTHGGTMMNGVLSSACSDAHKALTMHSEGIASLLQGASELCNRTEALCDRVAYSLRQADFQSMPHFSSPEKLIRSLADR